MLAEPLLNAISDLATGTDPLQRRLADAAVHLVSIHPDEFPPRTDYLKQLEGILADMTSRGTIEETCAALSDTEARGLAHRIFGLAAGYVMPFCPAP